MISRRTLAAHTPRLLLLLSAISVLLTGCSGSTTGPDATSTPRNLARGECPASILKIHSENQWDRGRYGAGVDVDKARELQALEIGNCRTQVAEGDVRALRVLESHYNQQRDMPRLVSTASTFLSSPGDTGAKRRVALEMHRLYRDGRYEFRPNQAESLRYLGLAVAYGDTKLRPQYAAALMQAGEFDRAFSEYSTLVNENTGDRESRCEYQLQLGYLYFAGAGAPQNSYLGYYYWQRGLALGLGPRWGSCIADNFSDQQRWRIETDRLKYVSPLIEALSTAEQSSIQGATRLSLTSGHSAVAAMDYQPAAPIAAITSHPMSTAAAAPSPGAWPGWVPMRGGICAMRHSSTGVSRAELFGETGNAVWTLVSANGEQAVLGSAVAVSASILLTNCHVISDPEAIALRNPLGQRTAKLISADKAGDRCILRSPQATGTFIGRARRHGDVMVGEDVSAVGSPKGMTNTLSRGIVAGKRERSGIRLIQTDAALSTGSSGGGLFDNRGNLIGITTFQIPEADSLNFAIAVEEFCAP